MDPQTNEMEMKPLFTIVIPTFNRRVHLEKSVRYALGQSYRDIELLVCDNCSQDDTQQYISTVQDPRLKYFRNSKNIGACANFLSGLSKATGKYCSILTDDDIIYDSFVQSAVEKLEENARAAAYACYIFGESSHTTILEPLHYGPFLSLDWYKGIARSVPGELVVPMSLFKTFAAIPCLAFRTALLHERLKSIEKLFCDPYLEFYGEYFLIALLCRDHELVADPKILGSFTIHEAQMSTNLKKAADWSEKRGRFFTEMDRLDAGSNYAGLAAFRGLIPEYSTKQLIWLYESTMNWPKTTKLVANMRICLEQALSQRTLTFEQKSKVARKSRPLVFRAGKAITPPIVYRSLASLYRRVIGN